MTHEEMIAVIQAHKEGKTIQFRSSDDNAWTDCYTNEPLWDFDDYDYRVKPELKYRTYASAEECFEDVKKHGMLIKGKEADVYHMIVAIANHCIFLGGVTMGISMDELLRDFQFGDGTPCGVKVED